MTERGPTKAWSYIAGEKGRNRVRVYERPPHGIWIDYRVDEGQRVRESLHHPDREQAKRHADEIAAQFGRTENRATQAVTLRSLIDIYLREVTPQKSRSTQNHDRRTFPLFLRAFGESRKPDTLNRRDWDSYIQRRRRGDLSVRGREGKAVRARVLEQDCNLLLALLNWGERAGNGTGQYLVERNPLKGLPVPSEESPRRAIITNAQYDAARVAAASISPRLETFVLLAWYTGHRGASIRQLRWSDVDLEAQTIHFRGELDKIGYDHTNPLHPESVAALKRERQRAGGIGDAWIFPSSRKPGEPLSSHAMGNLWKRIAVRAGIPTGQRYGWHSFRRAFANTLLDVPLRSLKDLGGWKTERTVVSVYQQPSQQAQRKALETLQTRTKTA
ncbi:MAG: integrase family protein [Gemmatimonadetes bacterium]|nr:integrase family protein [Gemmatimonadota bacterium]